MANETQPGQLVSLLHATGTAVSYVESKLATVGLSMAKLAALECLAQAGESLPLGQLADRLACVKSNVTQLVDRLEADNLVTRAADPSDRRARLAVMTDVGREAFRRGQAIKDEAEREFFQVLSAEELAQLSTIVKKIETYRA